MGSPHLVCNMDLMEMKGPLCKAPTGTWSHLLWKAPYSPICQGALQKGTYTLLFIGLFLLQTKMILAYTMLCNSKRRNMIVMAHTKRTRMTTMFHQNMSTHQNWLQLR